MTFEPRALISSLELESFRAYRSTKLHIPEQGLRISGRNGVGKTTIIEAVLLLSTTRSRRGTLDADLIGWGSGEDLGVVPYARVAADIERDGATARVDVFLEQNVARGTTRKLLKVSERSRRAADVVGLLPTVTFSPEDLDLVLGSPPVRRRWLDILLSQTDRKYLRYLTRYSRILSQRNGLLKHSDSTSGSSRSEFEYWDEQLSGLGSYIVSSRAIAAVNIASAAHDHFIALAPEVGELDVHYQSTLSQPEAWWKPFEALTNAEEAVQRVGVAYDRRMNDSFAADVNRGVTQVGPHRDDAVFTINGRPLSRFGSRGQQRLAVVALKLAESDFMSRGGGARPIVMLDDVLSELDPIHRRTLLDTVFRNGSQLIVTATEEDLLADPVLEDLRKVTISAPGEIGD